MSEDLFGWRLSRLKINNFRGLIGEHCLDVDADLVLIDGPNGFGKTSLLEAIILLLTGAHQSLDGQDDQALEGLVSKPLDGQEDRSGALKAYTKALDEKSPSSPGVLDLSLSGSPIRPQRLPSSQFSEGEGGTQKNAPHPLDSWKLEARLMSFFQEKVRDAFDDSVSGATLSQFLNENPAVVEKTYQCIDKAHERLDDQINDVEGRLKRIQEPNPELNRIFRQEVEKFREVYVHAMGHFDAWPAADAMPDDEGSENKVFEKELLHWLDDLTERWMTQEAGSHDVTPAGFLDPFRKALARRAETYRLKAEKDVDAEEYQRLEEELRRLNKRIADIEKRYPDLEMEVEQFSVEIGGARLNVAQWFFILASQAERWSPLVSRAANEQKDEQGKVVDDPLLRRVAGQFEQIDVEAARTMGKALSDWIEPRERAWKRKKDFVDKAKQIREKLEGYRKSEQYDDMRGIMAELQTRRAELEFQWSEQRKLKESLASTQAIEESLQCFRRQRKTLEKFKQELEAVKEPDKKILSTIRDMTNQLLFRFSLVEGVLPITIDDDGKKWIPKTADKRQLMDLSTGQKAQLAVGMMASQNLSAASKSLPRVLVLDDVSTSYDLSNLAREALLWRQLAYGGDGKYRRQVFISSHHEDMTNNLIDLLTPPAGKRMRLLRFVGWRPASGPEIEQYEVEPTAPTHRDKKPTTELKSFGKALCQLPF